jgi:two-component system, LuxR family, response regulator FixJ
MKSSHTSIPMKFTVSIVDDDEMVRKGLTRLLNAAGYDVQSFGSVGEFLFAKALERPGCVVLDIRMQGTGGLELQELLAQQGQSPPIIFLTGHGDISSSVRAMKAGAVDFLTKPVEREALLGAVRIAVSRDAEARVRREQVRILRLHYDKLTTREREVFERVVAGKPNKLIAAELGTVERTVKAHRAHVMEKMGADSFASLVHAAVQIKAAPAAPPRAAQS